MSDIVQIFKTDSKGDLVDIEYFCPSCADYSFKFTLTYNEAISDSLNAHKPNDRFIVEDHCEKTDYDIHCHKCSKKLQDGLES